MRERINSQSHYIKRKLFYSIKLRQTPAGLFGFNKFRCVISALALLVSSTELIAQNKAAQPNIIFLLVDDMGIVDLGCYGSKYHETPNIDALAASGIKFMNTYTAGTVCSPTRASIMTGRYPTRTGVTDWIPGQKMPDKILEQPKTKLFLDSSEITFAESLKKGGYSTFYAGKWHLGDKEGLNPLSQGFDEWYSGVQLRRAGSLVVTDSLTKHTSEFITRKAKEGKPFITFLSYYDVHTPLFGYPDYIAHYRNKAATMDTTAANATQPEHEGLTRMEQSSPQYASMVGAVDKSVGSLMKLLNTLGIDKNTIIIFTSDNGGLSTTKKVGPTSNEPYRAGKGWTYEGGIRVPLIIRYPGVAKPGSINNQSTISTDFYPTMLDWAGLPLMPKAHLDGVSFAPLLKPNGTLASRDFFWHYPHYHGSTWTPGAAVQSDGWKLIAFYETNTYELYNLKADPYEKKNLADANPAKVNNLKEKLLKWQQETGAKMPVRKE